MTDRRLAALRILVVSLSSKYRGRNGAKRKYAETGVCRSAAISNGFCMSPRSVSDREEHLLHQKTHLTISRWAGCVLCWTEPCVATSYGEDHHHCWAVTVFLRLIEDGVVLDELTGVNPFLTKLLCSQSRWATVSPSHESAFRPHPSPSPPNSGRLLVGV